MEERYGFRLRTKNFREVRSEAASSIDYYPKDKIIEIEFNEGGVYHYLDARKLNGIK